MLKLIQAGFLSLVLSVSVFANQVTVNVTVKALQTTLTNQSITSARMLGQEMASAQIVAPAAAQSIAIALWPAINPIRQALQGKSGVVGQIDFDALAVAAEQNGLNPNGVLEAVASLGSDASTSSITEEMATLSSDPQMVSEKRVAKMTNADILEGTVAETEEGAAALNALPDTEAEAAVAAAYRAAAKAPASCSLANQSKCAALSQSIVEKWVAAGYYLRGTPAFTFLANIFAGFPKNEVSRPASLYMSGADSALTGLVPAKISKTELTGRNQTLNRCFNTGQAL